MSDIIASDVQGHYIDSALVTLFEIEIDGDYAYFHAGLDENLAELQFVSIDGTTINTYSALPIVIDGMEIQADGAQSRPTITMANVTAVFKDALGGLKNRDLIGKTLIRRQTFAKYLYGSVPGSVTGSPPTEFPIREYIIDRISAETKTLVSFELASPFDLEGIQIPRRTIVGKYCSWAYQGFYSNPSYGACTWPLDSKVTVSNTGKTATVDHYFYFTLEDNPITAATYTYDLYNASTTYGQSAFVTDTTGAAWQSLFADNTGNIPSASSSWWRRVFQYEIYSSLNTYSRGTFVKYGNNIWKCLISNTIAQTPENRSKYWIRADICGKSLNSCKCRFQAVAADKDSADYGPSVRKNTAHSLPFGAFPGSSKFK